MSVAPRVALFVDRVDWHAKRLRQAMAARGVEAVAVSLADCDFAIEGAACLAIPGFDGRLPDGAFVRCVPGGSFQAVTLRLGLLHALREAGVAVFNDARAIERCVDKSMTSFLLQRAGIATPDTWVLEDRARALELVEVAAAGGAPLVLKPLFGSQGRGLKLVRSAADLPSPEAVDGVYYLQRYVETDTGDWRDCRVLVVGDLPVAAMMRVGQSWITNVRQGASVEAIPLDKGLGALAVRALDAVGAGYAGVDVIRDRDGRLLVLEVNSMPAWSALQKVSETDVTQAIADAFLAEIGSRQVMRAESARRGAGG